MINLLEPFGNTETFGWPLSCHMPYWVEGERTLLSSAAVFDFLGVNNRHDYKCYSFHLEYHGFKNAFAGDSENDSRFISFEAFLHFLFGGLFPFCHCEKSAPSSKIPEVRKFFMEKLTKGHGIGIFSASQETSAGHKIAANHDKQTRKDVGATIKIGKCFSIDTQHSGLQGEAYSQQPVSLQNNTGRHWALTRKHMIRVNGLNNAPNERLITENIENASITHQDSQLSEIRDEVQSSSSFVSIAEAPADTIRNNSSSNVVPVRLHEQGSNVSIRIRSDEPSSYTQRKSKVHISSTNREDQLSFEDGTSAEERMQPDNKADNERGQSNTFTNIVIKKEKVDSDQEQQHETCSFATPSDHQLDEVSQVGTEDTAVDCGPIEVVHLPQEIATGASYFDPSTSSITTCPVDSHMTGLQQGDGTDSQGEYLSSESGRTVEHSSLLNQTPDGISRHLQYSHAVVSVEQENSDRTLLANTQRNKKQIQSAPLHSRHKPKKFPSSTYTLTNYSQSQQQFSSPESSQGSFHIKRKRTDREGAPVPSNIIRHPSAASVTELSSIPPWISLGATPRTQTVRTGTHDTSSDILPSSLPNVSRTAVHYQGTSLLNSNVEQSSSSAAAPVPRFKSQGNEGGASNTPMKKTDQENSTTVTPFRHNIQSPQQAKTMFKVIESGTKHGKLKLFSSRGYTYSFKRSVKSGRDWQCTIRPKANPCRAIVKEREGKFIPGISAHNHASEAGAVLAFKFATMVKHKAVEDIF